MTASHVRGPGPIAHQRAFLRLSPLVLLALAACQSVPDSPPYEPDPSIGMLIARDSCSGCHATGPNGESPNSRALPFREIAERPGLTPEALAAWLKDGHDYPVEMGFVLAPHQVDSLVAYMMRQQSAGTAPQP